MILQDWIVVDVVNATCVVLQAGVDVPVLFSNNVPNMHSRYRNDSDVYYASKACEVNRKNI